MTKIIPEKIVVSLFSIISLVCLFSPHVAAICGKDSPVRPVQPFIGSETKNMLLSRTKINGRSVILYRDGTRILLDEEQKDSWKHRKGKVRYAPTLPSGWTSTGPYGGMVSTLTLDPVDPNIIYVGTYNSGIFKSTDGGMNWTPKGLENTFDVITIAIDPSNPEILYASTETDYGLFKSVDGGNSWTNIGFDYHNVFSIAIDPLQPSWVYVGTDLNDCIWLSTDGGENWTPLLIPQGGGIHWKILVLPDSTHTIYVLYGYMIREGNPGGIRKSTDGGTTWTIVNNGLGEPPIFGSDLTFDPNQPNVLYVTVASEIEGVFKDRLCKTTDACSTWNVIGEAYLPQGAFFNSIAIDPSKADILYITLYPYRVSNPGGVYKSMDAGETWARMNKGLPQYGAWPIVIDYNSTNTIYVGYNGSGCREGGVYKTTNGGISWEQINNGLTANDVRTVMVDPNAPNTIYAGTMNGEWKSTDGGQTWQSINDGLYIQWDPWFTEEGILSQAISRRNSDRIYTGTGYWAGDGLFRTDNGGQSWYSISNGLPDINYEVVSVDAIAVDPTDDRIAYAGLYAYYSNFYWGSDDDCYGIYKTTDAGVNWTKMNTGLTDSCVICLAIDPGSTNVIYAGTNKGVFKSTDAGTTWTTAGTTGTHITALVIDTFDTKIIYTTTAGFYDWKEGGIGKDYYLGKGIFKSTDAGTSWTQVNSGLPYSDSLGYVDVFSLSINPVDPNRFYAGTDVGVYRGIDGGLNWSLLDSGLTYVWSVTSVHEGDSTTIYAGTCSYGVVQYKEEVVGIEDSAPDLSSTGQVILYQNYPNPFNSLTTINYSLPKSVDGLYESIVSLKIYDISGRLVKIFDLTNNSTASDVQSPFNQVVWNGKDEFGQNAASGIYFYQLELSGSKEIRKMTLIR